MQRGSEAQRRRRIALAVIFEMNERGQLLSGPAGRGFVDARGTGRRLLGGVTPHIKAAPKGRLKRLFSQHRLDSRTIRFCTFGKHASRPRASTLHAGRVVHRELMHRLTCEAPARFDVRTTSPHFNITAPLDGAACRCEAVHGPMRVQASERPLLDVYVAAARTFIKIERLVPVLAEQVIVDERLGTRFDALMARYSPETNTEELVLVSWKTGGAALYTGGGTKHHAENTERRNRYITQVLYEIALLSKTYGVRIDSAYIVNLLATEDGAAGYFMRLTTEAIDAAPAVYAELHRLADNNPAPAAPAARKRRR